MLHENATDAQQLEIQRVLARYGHVMDGRDVPGLEEVFTPDAVFDTSSVGGEVHRGIDALCAFLLRGDTVHPPFHLLTNVWAYREGESLKSMSKWLTIDRDSGLPRSGDYLDTWRATDDGLRITERIARARWGGGPWAAGYEN